MALRLETAIAGTRLRWPGTYGVLLLLVIVMLVESARAEDSDEAYSATVKGANLPFCFIGPVESCKVAVRPGTAAQKPDHQGGSHGGYRQFHV